MAELYVDVRSVFVRRALVLEYLTLAWNFLEGLAGVAAGLASGSISLFGFGFDSFIEVMSSSVLLWRLSIDPDESTRERNERVALRIVGLSFLGLAICIGYMASSKLWLRQAPQHSIPGIVLAGLALVVMPVLSRAKRSVGRALGSAALRADAKQSEFCAYLSALLLLGLLLNALFGFWWADPLAALVMVPIIAREGLQALRGNPCSDCHP